MYIKLLQNDVNDNSYLSKKIKKQFGQSRVANIENTSS